MDSHKLSNPELYQKKEKIRKEKKMKITDVFIGLKADKKKKKY